jgi:pilus assembly protein Flp/PilA
LFGYFLKVEKIMMLKFQVYVIDLMDRLRDEEEGLALTEYLILLGLLTAVVVGAVLTFGQNLGFKWGEWSAWLLDLKAPQAITN